MRVVVMTASQEECKAKEQGVLFLAKPFEDEAFLALVRGALGEAA